MRSKEVAKPDRREFTSGLLVILALAALVATRDGGPDTAAADSRPLQLTAGTPEDAVNSQEVLKRQERVAPESPSALN